MLALVLGKVIDASPVVALFQAPAMLISALPMIAQLMFALVFVVAQFAALFWFLSRGGVETYYPTTSRPASPTSGARTTWSPG